ncbi:MAG: b-lactamase [Parcubacteria bacterium C7867-001]|nr:MAG: b-lactamase [Parcubacteria bacterium C7867-001]
MAKGNGQSFSKGAIFAGAGLVIGIGIGFGSAQLMKGQYPTLQEQREEFANYSFISPLLACADPSAALLGNNQADALEKKLKDFASFAKAQGYISDVGVYFRQLNGGPWIGVGEDAEFTPASLLKVPLVISVFRAMERDPAIAAKEISYTPDESLVTQHFPAQPLVKGVYSAEELAAQTLESSDNNAALALAGAISSDQLFDAYTHLGIIAPEYGEDYSTTVRKYASFFRILYNATYLSHENSEKLLAMLSKSVFTQGIVAGLPEGTIVSHKFGERQIDGTNTVQLHDCGIVYLPHGPYILCVMMRGSDFDTLAEQIATVSKIVYEYAK